MSKILVAYFSAGGVTAEQAAYLFSESNTASRNSLSVFSGSLSGEAVKPSPAKPGRCRLSNWMSERK